MKKEKKYKAVKTSNRWINSIQKSLIASLLIHWFFQSLLYMDKTERYYKLMITIVLSTIFMMFLSLNLKNLLLSLILSHTLNFLFNGQINGVLKSFDISRTDVQGLEAYVQIFKKRVTKESSIQFAAIYGSYTRNTLGQTSDLDIRLVRKTGKVNAFKSCSFVLFERCKALFTGIPLDIYVFDTHGKLSIMREDEKGNLLKDV